MKCWCRTIRSRPLERRALLVVASLVCAAQPTLAQQRDTLIVRQDTLVVDSVTPPKRLVELAFPFAQRRPAGVYYWDRDALAATSAISMLDLLRIIPGLTTFRSGLFLQPEAASAFGGTSARLEVDLDGYVLDPLDGSALDLSTIELSGLDEVLVERRLDLLRIRLRSATARDPRPYSRVEAGIGQPDVNVFRGVFTAPRLLGGPFGFAVERVDTDGVRGAQPADSFDGWLQWGFHSENRGVQLELRQNSLDREPRSPWPQNGKRRDLVLRARNRFGALAAEGYIGGSSTEIQPIDTIPFLPDSLRSPLLERSARQAGLRASLGLNNAWVEGGVRYRDEPTLPRLQTDVGAGIALPGVASIRADLTHQSWRGASSTLALSLRADAGPVLGVVPFAEWHTGERGAPLYADSLQRRVIDSRSGLRVGVEANHRYASLGAAALRVDVDSVPAFGLPFDSAARYFPGGQVNGFEAFGRVRLFADWLAAEGSWTRWQSTPLAYMPTQLGRGALVLHASPLRSGNFEIFGSFEALRRGEMLAPGPGSATGNTLVPLPASTLVNAYLQIRIIDVRIFLRYDDLLGQDPEDVPGWPIPGPRLIYGVKWQFWN